MNIDFLLKRNQYALDAEPFEMCDAGVAQSTAEALLVDCDDADSSAFVRTRCEAELERVQRAFSESLARSSAEGHLVWESHIRELDNDTIDNDTLRQWLADHMMYCPAKTLGPAITLNDVWIRFTCTTGLYCCRGLFGSLLRRALGRIAAASLWSSRDACECQTRWCHLHGFVWREAPPPEETLNAAMRAIIARKHFERGTIQARRPTRRARERCVRPRLA